MRNGEDPTLAALAVEGQEEDVLSARGAAICRYAVKSTLTPSKMTEADLDELRGHGLADADLLVLAHVIGFFNQVNRVADCLHVDPEPNWDPA